MRPRFLGGTKKMTKIFQAGKGIAYVFPNHHETLKGRRGGLMISALDSRARSPGSGPRHCVVFWSKTLRCLSPTLVYR